MFGKPASGFAPRRKLIPGRYSRSLLDIALLSGAFAFAYLLRFDFDVPSEYQVRTWLQLPIAVGLFLVSFRICGIHTFIWRYVGIAELPSFAGAVILGSVPLVVARMALPDRLAMLRVPLSVSLMFMVLSFLGIMGIRVLRRMVYEYVHLAINDAPDVRPRSTLLIGAGRAGTMAAKELMGRRDSSVRPLGFIDNDPEKLGAVVSGLRVLGHIDDLERIVRETRAEQVIITLASVSGDDIRQIVQRCEEIPIKVRQIPPFGEVVAGKVRVSAIRDVEIEDLLAREPVILEPSEAQRFIEGQTVMVTGAGGSIGSELCRQVLALGPAKLLMLERSEPALYQIHREVTRSQKAELFPLVADVTDEARISSILARHRPDVVFHAAAHKHVPMMELNPVEGIKNNVFGTHLMARLSGDAGVRAFVLISTDKAVRPSSMMGASKRLAELAIQGEQRRYRDTRFVAVRFGNVLGSAGSVIPLFKEQIAAGGPVTVTHPDMERYFMTIPEASRLVVEAGAMGTGGEIFVLDMGEPIRIVDLARRMIQLSGLRPEEDIPITFSGVRPGEKLTEDLHQDGELIEKTRHPQIFIGTIAEMLTESLEVAIVQLERHCREDDEEAVRRYVSMLIPEATVVCDREPPSAPPVLATRNETLLDLKSALSSS